MWLREKIEKKIILLKKKERKNVKNIEKLPSKLPFVRWSAWNYLTDWRPGVAAAAVAAFSSPVARPT